MNNINLNIPEQQVIVSLTSFPAAIAYATKAIQSVFLCFPTR